jgi:hypothetical protein
MEHWWIVFMVCFHPLTCHLRNNPEAHVGKFILSLILVAVFLEAQK